MVEDRTVASGNSMCPAIESGRRDYVIAELRCASVRAKLAQVEIETIAIALKSNLVSVDEAVLMFQDSESIHFLGLELGWASTLREPHDDG